MEPIRAPRGAALSCRGWVQEAALRMPLHPVDEPPILALRQPLEGERRAQGVSAQALETCAIVPVDPDPGVEGEAVEERAGPGVLEGVREAQAAVHFGGLECGEGVGLRPHLLVVSDEDLGSSPDNAARGPSAWQGSSSRTLGSPRAPWTL